MNSPDAIVIGAGQSGLAAAHALTARGLRPVVLETGPEPVGSWPHYYDSLTLFSPAAYSTLPGLPFPGDPQRYPHRDEVADYLRRYAATLDADIQTGQRVLEVQTDGAGFAVHTPTRTLTTPLLIAATGGFGNPYRPPLPGLDAFTGEILHASEYRSPDRFAGQHVVIVGAGNSAVQIGVELAHHARVTLATRNAVTFVPQRPLGRDLHYWFTAFGIDHLPIGPQLRNKPTVPVFDTGAYRSAINADQPRRVPLFTDVDGARVTWPDGHSEHVDTILLATGYRPDLGYLAKLGALDRTGAPQQLRGLSTTHPGLGYVGIEWQRSLASASLRGVGRDADYVTAHLLRRVNVRARCCAALRS
ncbi:flavin-containing monooxygenase [Pseudonocardia alaniniphila]|uniref:NAD(P)/FAD-dependent oxidoreductase n=1 Tax=Pseudonocardia alaniniphila TaxID=75291 RepID=A0ABS9T9M3_9PSEU|nr:NAD(P)-binding domain-containing protein [Pseudonocardia alaniniphila]MCH6165234.1 NAD(P)/FAD-dependent oxidoreductase [Pseudonocardia alaniniphila]